MLTGKIAASSGHAVWISSKTSRDRVFDLRGRSDAVVVGGNTVRRDSKYHLCDYFNKLSQLPICVLFLDLIVIFRQCNYS